MKSPTQTERIDEANAAIREATARKIAEAASAPEPAVERSRYTDATKAAGNGSNLDPRPAKGAGR